MRCAAVQRITRDLAQRALHVIALQWLIVALYQAQDRLSIFGAWPVAVDRFAAAAGKQETILGELAQCLARAPDIAINASRSPARAGDEPWDQSLTGLLSSRR
jgi:hypothetical protein